jgi:glycosyltransferase involved in cell wall biosynthesis
VKLLVISSAFPPMQAGEATNAFHLCEHLAAQNVDVHVLTGRQNNTTRDPRITVHPIMRTWSWSELPRLARFLTRCAPDAVLLFYIHFVYNDHPMITFAPTLCRRLLPSVPFVTRFENPIGIPPRRRSLRNRLIRRAVMQWAGNNRVDYMFGTLLRDSHSVIALAERHRRALVNLSADVSRKSVLIPPPPNMRICPEENGNAYLRGRRRLRVPAESFLLAYLGYIYPNKGIETLLSAMQMVSAERNNVRLILLGGTITAQPDHLAYADAVRALGRRLGIEDRLTWIGEYRSDTDEASLCLRAADACVLPFDIGVQLNNSSFSSAAAHGLPIITTRGDTLESPFVHRENVLLCPPKSPQAMAESITLLMDNPDLRQRLALGALKLAQEWFSWESATERTMTTLTRPRVPGC